MAAVHRFAPAVRDDILTIAVPADISKELPPSPASQSRAKCLRISMPGRPLCSHVPDGWTLGPFGSPAASAGESPVTERPRWMATVLLAAAAYNLAWGLAAIFSPTTLFAWAGMPAPLYPQLWQCIGMIVGVYGVGFAIAASDPYRHWPIVLVGLLGKVLGPVGFAAAMIRGSLPPAFGVTIVPNDLVWWVPFAMILWAAFRHHTDPAAADASSARLSVSEAMRWADVQVPGGRVTSLSGLSGRRRQLVVFLRHGGCVFCREALHTLAAERQDIESQGTGLVVVQMGTPEQGRKLLNGYGLADVPLVSDPQCRLYRAFGLERGRFGQLFGPSVFARGVVAFCRDRHGIGTLVGDGFQMPGVFLVHEGRVVRSHVHAHAGDVPDYVAMARPPVPAPAAAGPPAPQRQPVFL